MSPLLKVFAGALAGPAEEGRKRERDTEWDRQLPKQQRRERDREFDESIRPLPSLPL
jgi:hypothetical protein